MRDNNAIIYKIFVLLRVIFLIKAVLFDLDGTLVNTLGDLSKGVNAELAKRGYPTHPKDAFKIFVGNGIPKMVERAAPVGTTPEVLKEMTDSFVAYYSVHYADYTEAYSGTAELISAVKDKGIKVAVVTNKAQGPAELVVDKFFGDSLLDRHIFYKPLNHFHCTCVNFFKICKPSSVKHFH